MSVAPAIVRLRSWPIWAFAIAVAVGLLAAGLTMAVYNEKLARVQKIREVTVQADILAGSVAAALAFDDEETAREYVTALSANRDVEAAGVYGLDGKLLAGYKRDGAAPPTLSRAAAPSLDDAHIVVSAPVVQNGVRLGSVYLRTAREPVQHRVARYAGAALLVLMAALMVTVLGLSNASLIEAQRRLKGEMEERARTEEALRLSQELEAAAQIEIAAQRAREALRQSERQLEFALQAGRLGSWAVDLRDGSLKASDIFLENFGISPENAPTLATDLEVFVHPDDRNTMHRARDAAVLHGAEYEAEFRIVSPQGQVRWMLARGQAVPDPEGGQPRWVTGVSLDITGRKQAEERQRLLLDELNHRVKNTLATVQSIALQTGRSLEDPAAFAVAFQARLSALARVHDLLSRVSWEGASLSDTVRQTLAPHFGLDDQARLALGGPEVQLGPNAAVTLAMAFNELATNAAKYGALTAPAGQVEVRWQADDAAEPGMLEIHWCESGGPPVAIPARRGFGSRFVERGLAREFGGSVDLLFNPMGVECWIRIPLSVKLRLTA